MGDAGLVVLYFMDCSDDNYYLWTISCFCKVDYAPILFSVMGAFSMNKKSFVSLVAPGVCENKELPRIGVCILKTVLRDFSIDIGVFAMMNLLFLNFGD